MNTVEGKLKRNDMNRWEIEEFELTSGAALDLFIEGHWIEGNIEFWNGSYHWFSRMDGVPVILHSGLHGRTVLGRYVNF